MASPEVERPITSPSNPVLSPHGLSPGNAGPAATRPSPGSSTSRKVVTFDHGLSASVDVDRNGTNQLMQALGTCSLLHHHFDSGHVHRRDGIDIQVELTERA